MKKLVVLLLALTMVVGAVSAQATVNGYVRSWGTYEANSGDFTLANRLRLTLGFTSADGNVTFGTRLQVGNWMAPGATEVYDYNDLQIADYAYGQIKLAEGKVVVSGGRLWNFDYDISSSGSDYAATGNVVNGAYTYFYAAGADGMLFQVLPVEGLNIGLLVRPEAGDSGLEEFGLGAKYTIADIGDVIVTAVGADQIEDTNLTASFAFTGVEGLFAAVGYKGLSAHGIYALVNYSKDALFAEVAPEYNVTDETFYIEGLVKYTMGDIAISGLAGYDNGTTLGNEFWVGGELYYTVGKGQIVLIAQYGDVAGFSCGPVVRVNF